MQNKLFVRNLSFRVSDSELNDLFSAHGNVVSARMATDRETGRARGFAFVEMSTHESAQDAIRTLDNSEFNGRIMHVAMSEPRSAAYGNDRRPSTAYGTGGNY